MVKIKKKCPHATIVVIHYGNPDDTLACVNSLLQLDYKHFNILVVNNGTPKESLQRVTEKSSMISVLDFPENLGFAAAANIGLNHAVKAGSLFAWLVNNDIVVNDHSSLDTLVSTAQKNDAVVVSPSIAVQGRHGERVWSGALFFPGLALTFHKGAKIGKFLSAFFKSIPFISGTAVLVNLKTAPMPFFDNKFFAYYEDLDLCLRLGHEHFEVCQKSHVFHKVSAGTGGGLKKHYLKGRNLVYLARKHGFLNRGFILCYWLLFAPMEARKYFGSMLSFWRTTGQAWRDGLAMPC